MSRTVIGYTGEGRARRPVYQDLGPSSARVSSGPGGSGDPDVKHLLGSPLLVGAGAGPVERRMVDDAQRAAWAAQAEGARERLVSSHTASHPVRQRPPMPPAAAATHALEEVTPVSSHAPEPVVQPEEPREAPTPAEIDEHVDAIVARGVLDHLEDDPTSRDPLTEGFIEIRGPDCQACLHFVVCAIRPMIPVELGRILPSMLPTGIRLAAMPWVALSCDHRLTATTAPAAHEAPPAPVIDHLPPATSRYSSPRAGIQMGPKAAAGQLTAREEALIEGIRQTGRILPGASAVGIPRGSAHGLVLGLRSRGLLPVDVEELLTVHGRPTRRR